VDLVGSEESNFEDIDFLALRQERELHVKAILKIVTIKNRDLIVKLEGEMKKTKFTESQIIGILKDQEQGKKVTDICREYGISQPTFYQWKSKYSGLDANQLKRLKDLEAELAQYKKIVAEQALDIRILKDLNSKKF